MSDYEPIACAAYDVFEIAIMRGQWLFARWKDDRGDEHAGRIRPVDLRIFDRAEHLLARNEDGVEIALRLDRIVSAVAET